MVLRYSIKIQLPIESVKMGGDAPPGLTASKDGLKANPWLSSPTTAASKKPTAGHEALAVRTGRSRGSEARRGGGGENVQNSRDNGARIFVYTVYIADKINL